MLIARTIVAGALAIAFLPDHLAGQSFARYRDFELEATLASVSALTGVAESAARTVQQRPSVLQELEWRPSPWSLGLRERSTDPVERILFTFQDDQLFRVVVDYAYGRTEGMTDADLIAAISEVYGPPSAAASADSRVISRVETESGAPVATWGDGAHAVMLYRRSSYRDTFRLIVTARAIEESARLSALESARLDVEEAPAREAARKQKAEDDSRSAAEQARGVNKDAFRP